MRVLLVFFTAISFTLLGCGSAPPAQRSSESPTERPPKTFTISNGDSVTYQPGGARPGDKIICVGGGGAVIPKPGTWSRAYGTGPGGSTEVSVSTSKDGSVSASCKIL